MRENPNRVPEEAQGSEPVFSLAKGRKLRAESKESWGNNFSSLPFFFTGPSEVGSIFMLRMVQCFMALGSTMKVGLWLLKLDEANILQCLTSGHFKRDRTQAAIHDRNRVRSFLVRDPFDLLLHSMHFL
jgi:hypothetical protein